MAASLARIFVVNFVFLLTSYVSVAAAEDCTPELPWSYKGACYETREAAEQEMRTPSGAKQNWRIHFELEQQVGNKYIYHLPDQEHLPSPAWQTAMPNGDYRWGWRSFSSPYFPTRDEAYQWVLDYAAKPTSYKPQYIVSDDLLYRGTYTTISGNNESEHWIYSHNYTPIPVSLVDFEAPNLSHRYCNEFTPGMEDSKVSKFNHSIYKLDSTPDPTVLHVYFNNCSANGAWYRIQAMPTIDIKQVYVSPCQLPYTDDGEKCVSDLKEEIVEGPQYALSAPSQNSCPDNESNPCNPADGTKSQVEVDFSSQANGGLTFARYYRSKGEYKSDPYFAAGWRHTYSRRLDESPDRYPQVAVAVPADQSQFYYSAEEACSSGWTDIKDAVWSGDLSTAIPTFEGGNVCRLEKAGTTVAYFPVRKVTGWSGYSSAAGVKTITRPNGTSVKFEFDGSSWINRLNPSLRLEEVPEGWVFTDKNDTKERYDVEGRLVQIETRAGLVTTLHYASGDPNTLDRVTGPFGQEITLNYNSNQQLHSVSTPDGTISYTLQNGNLANASYPGLETRHYVYERTDLPNHLTGIIDENGDRFATWDYDSAGRAILSERGVGQERVEFTYKPDGSTTLTLGNGAVRNYIFSTEQGARKIAMLTGNVCASCPGGDIADRTYDNNGFPDEKIDWNGVTTKTIRNRRGLTETLVEAQGSGHERTTTIEWDSTYRLPVELTTSRNTTNYAYDPAGNLSSITISDGVNSRSWTFTHNASGQVLTIDGPRTDVADVTTFTYYDCTSGNRCGQLHTITNALGHVTTFEQYSKGRPTKVVDPNGMELNFSYGNRGRITRIQRYQYLYAGREDRFVYDSVGQITNANFANGLSLSYTYDEAHYLRTVTDNFGNRIEFEYDEMGNRSSENVFDASNALMRNAQYAYDLNGRLAEITRGGFTSQLVHDLVGNLQSETMSNGANTTFVYDALNRLQSTIDALNGTTSIVHEDSDQVSEVVAANGATTTFVYDGLENLLEESSPDRGTTTYTYDEAGNVLTKIDARGELTRYSYDALNRLSTETLNDGTLISYEYDVGQYAIGRLTRIVDPTGQTEWTYTGYGNVASKTQTIGPVSLTTSYNYNSTTGNLTRITYPSGKRADISYTNFLPTRVDANSQTILTGAIYEPFGPVQSWTWGYGMPSSRTFDGRGLQTSFTLTGDLNAINRDSVGNITSQSTSELSVEYDYDLLGRLTAFDSLNSGGGGSAPEPMFSQAPVLLADLQTANNETGSPPAGNPTPWMTPAVRNVTASGVQLALGRAEVATGSIVTAETIGYVAIEAGTSGTFATGAGSIVYEAQVTPDFVRGWGNGCYTTGFLSSFASAPTVVATINRHDGGDGGWVRRCSLNNASVGLTIDEDTYRDTERNHTTEAVGFAAFSSDFDAVITDALSTWKMEAATVVLGSTSADPTFKSITFRQAYSVPPIVVALATSEGGDPSAIRIRNVTVNGFEAAQVEPANMDGTHIAMTMQYFAIEPGTHELPDGTRILAGSVSTASQQHGAGVTGGEGWHSLTFADWPGATGGSGSQLLSQLFAYDANGNRTQLTENGIPYSYTNKFKSNRLLSKAGPEAKTYAYDAAGNIVADGVHSYGYDERGRLVTVDSGATAVYAYNALGQRVRKDAGATTILFGYDEAGNLIGEYAADGTPIREHVWFAGAPVAVLSESDTFYVHTDHLGTPRVISDGATAVWRWDSTPFGVTAANEDPDGDSVLFTYNLRFPGQFYDIETQLHYNYFRTYDPATGRYLESDPIGLAGGLNTYGYVGGNPLSSIDPYGLDCISIGTMMRCTFPGGGVDFRVPAPPEQPTSMGRNSASDLFAYHKTDVQVPIGDASEECVMRKLIENPTPGDPAPATRSGTRNNAKVFGLNNMVTSYVTNDLGTKQQVVVNVADPNSLLFPGYVARTVRDGTVRTYGEGLALEQTLPVGPRLGNWWYWHRQMEQIVEECSCEN